MKESINLTLSMDEITEAILNYLKEKNIYIPEDATLKFGEDVYNAYAIVSYTKDVDIDKVEDESQASIDENPNDDGRDDAIKEILDIDSQPLSIQNAYFYLRSLNYFNSEVTKNIIFKNKDTIDNTINLMKRIAHADIEKAINMAIQRGEK